MTTKDIVKANVGVCEMSYPASVTTDDFQVETIACPLCSSYSCNPWGDENGFSVVKCAECGLVYVNPRPSLHQIDEGHRIGKHRTPEGNLAVTFRPAWNNLAGYRADIRTAFSDEIASGKPLSWLDVGAGYGEFVEALQETLPPGSRVEGIDPMEAKVAYAQLLSLPVTTTSLDAVNRQYDVVSLLNVFSRIPNFRDFLSELKACIKPGGSLFLQTGNGGDLDTRAEYPDKLLLPDHLVFAGREHIERFLSDAGFNVAWSAARRKDTLFWSVKSVAKRLVGRRDPLILPYQSKFRDMRYRARLEPRSGA